MSLPRPPPPPPPPPLSRSLDRQGYLLRYETVGGRSGWKRRWAVLCDSCLYLYKDPDGKECLYALLLTSARVTQSHDSTGQYRSSIKLEEPNQLAVYLSTGTQEEFEAWYLALSAASIKQQQQQQHMFEKNLDSYNYNSTVVTSSDLIGYRRQSGSASEVVARRRQLTVSQPNLAQAFSVNHYQHEQQPEYQMPYAAYPPAAAAADSGASAVGSLRTESDEAQYAVVRVDPPFVARTNYPVDRVVNINNGILSTTGASASFAHNTNPRRMNGGGAGAGVSADPSSYRLIETVREDPYMDDNQVLATAPLEEIRRRYPVSGLAKRMSIAASDLLGKPHDELLLLLIQLQREKATLERRRDHCLRLAAAHSATSATAERLRQEIREAEHQLELSEPLLSFIANIIAMGAMYQGDDLAFASEYRRHLLQPGQARPARPVIGQQRRRQEAEVARQCQPAGSGSLGSVAFEVAEGDVEFRRTRRRLESELANLEAAYAEHRRRKSGLADFMADLGRRSGGVGLVSKSAGTGKRTGSNLGSYLETDLDTGDCVDLAAKFPRRNVSANVGVSTFSPLRAAVSTPALNSALHDGYSGYGYGYANANSEDGDEGGYFGGSGPNGYGRQQLNRAVGLREAPAPNNRMLVEQALSVQTAMERPPPLPQRRLAGVGGDGSAGSGSVGGRRSVSVQELLNSQAVAKSSALLAEAEAEAAAADRKARIRRVLAGYSLQEFTRQELGGLSLAEERRRRELAMAEREHVGSEASRAAIRGYLQ